MNKAIAIIALAAAVCSCGNKNGNYTVNGQFEGFSGKLWLVADDQPIDSVKTSDGNFTFKGVCEVPAIAYVCDSPNRREAETGLMFFLEPGDIHMESNKAISGNYYMAGTTSNDKKAEYTLRSIELVQEWTSRMGDPNLNAEIDSIEAAMTTGAIKSNPDNMYGLWQLKQYSYELTDAAELESYLNAVAPELRNTQLYKGMEESARKMRTTSIGQPFIEIKMASIEGNEISLTDVTKNPDNKYVLIDFWASWCGPCMGEVPYLVETYAKYHSKGFEIFGVSLDRTAEPWKAAIERNAMNWIHVSDLAYWNCAGAALYGVNSIPANFLVDCSTGKIVAKGLRGHNLEKTISDLLDR